MYCGKTADWIRTPFTVMSGVGRGMSVLDRSDYRRRERAVLGVNVGRSIEPMGTATRSSKISSGRTCYY